MKPTNLVVAAVILAALSGALWWAKRHPESTPAASTTPPSPKLASIPEKQIREIDITKRGSPTVTLARQNGKWAITQPEQFSADQDAAGGVVTSFDPLNADSVVENNPRDPGMFGLKSPSLTVDLKQANGKSQEILFGDDVPAGSLVYAEVQGSPKVYAVSSYTKTSLDKTLNDLRDKRLLTFDTNRLTRIELVSSKSDIEFGKNNNNEWQILKPQPYRAENFQVDELVRKLGDAKMDLSGAADQAAKADAAFKAGQPVATAKATDAGGTQTLEVRKNKDDYYAKSSAVPGDYKIASDLGKELEKPVDDFRNKKIFDFGFSDPTKIEIQQGATDETYVRAGSDWKLNGQTMSAGSVQAMIDKLRDLSSTKFVDTGFTSPALSVSITYNDGKRTERAEFAKAGDVYVARRENEPALYQLDGKPVNDILEANKAVKPAATHKK